MSVGLVHVDSSTRCTKTNIAKFPYLPGLDGLRALAVIAVLVYHAAPGWLPGGFLGVEVFFVISGYLITSLLLAEWQATGSINLKNFWLRRIRRLLPALFIVLIATMAFSVVFLQNEVASLRSDVLAALGYITNWHLIFSNQSYFTSIGRPSLLRHLWSLAVEEQFYLLWPILFLISMRLLQRRGTLISIILGIFASTALMAFLYIPDTDPSRVYYGTDTRAAGLLIGAALAFIWPPRRYSSNLHQKPWLDVLGIVSVAGLCIACFFINEYELFLYRGGFFLVAITTAIVIAVSVHSRAKLGKLLSFSPLRWLGLRSYGIYLWHWPVFMVSRPQLDVPFDGLLLIVLRLTVTIVLAEISYRYIETPIRKGTLIHAWKTLQETRGSKRRVLGASWASAGAVTLALVISLGQSVVSAQPPTPPAYFVSLSQEQAENAMPEVASTTATPTVFTTRVMNKDIPEYSSSFTTEKVEINESPVTPTLIATPTKENIVPTSTPEAALPKKTASPEPMPNCKIYAIGDSVMLGASKELKETLGNNVEIDAILGRQASEAIEILHARKENGSLGKTVIIHLGNNGVYTAKQLDQTMIILANVDKVVFVNDKVPRQWQDINNTALTNINKTYNNIVLVDWYAASSAHPELFWDDGIHVRPEGAQLYAKLIANAINQ